MDNGFLARRQQTDCPDLCSSIGAAASSRQGTAEQGPGRLPTEQLTPPFGVSARLVDTICEIRRERHEFFPGNLFSDPAWDILLRLYVTHLEQYRTTVTALISSTGIPSTTLLRWLKALVAAGLVTRQDDPFDGRRVYVSLSHKGADSMHRYLATSGVRSIFV